MPKIDPYCAFTINLGPQYVERVFDSLLTKQGVKGVVLMDTVERLERYLQYLHRQAHHSDLRRYTYIQFYIAHFSQQLAAQPSQEPSARHLREKAICHYEGYLELAEDTAESRFYSQWQVAQLQDELDYPWPQTESSLLKATTFDPLRGEPLKKLIDHYCRVKAWKTAYSLSNLAIRNYLDRNPAVTRLWFLDFAAYNWKLIHTHLHTCYKSGHLQEAEQAYQQLLTYTHRHPDEVTSTDICLVQGLERLFQATVSYDPVQA